MESFFEHYWEIMSDPAHLAAEVSLMLLVDVLFLGLIWPLIRAYVNRKIRKAHRELDAEHGVTHDPITGAITTKPPKECIHELHPQEEEDPRRD